MAKLDSKRFSSKDSNQLEQIIVTKNQQLDDKQISIILTDALEIIRLCGLLLSKAELETSSSTVRIDSNDWRQLGNDSVYYKLDDFLKEMHSNKYITSLSYALGGTVFYRLVNRAGYVDFIYGQIKGIIRNIGSILNPKKSLGIQITIDILRRIDPDLKIVTEWIRGNNSKDFEKGISILLPLCGFKTIYVGGEYENASLKARREKYKLGKSNIDMIALSKDERHVVLYQCTIDSIDNKIRDLINISTEVNKNIEWEDVELHPVIMTSVSRSRIVSSLDTALNNNISVFTIEDLEDIIKKLNDSKSSPYNILDKISGG